MTSVTTLGHEPGDRHAQQPDRSVGATDVGGAGAGDDSRDRPDQSADSTRAQHGCAPAHADVDPRTERTLAAMHDAALALLIDAGPSAVTHARVAAAARVSRTTVYKHHPDRADLLRATLRHFGAEMPAPEITGDLRTDLGAVLELLLHDLGDHDRSRAFAAMIERSLHDADAAEVLHGLIGEGMSALRAVLASGRTSGQVRPQLDDRVAISAMVGSLLFRRLLLHEELSPDAIDDILDDLLVLIG